MVSDKLLTFVALELSAEITHLGVGDGAAPDVDDVLLPDEVLRKTANSYLDGVEVIKEIYLDETELNGTTLKSAGVYGNGNTEMYAGGTFEVLKQAGESLTISVEITVGRE